MIIEAGQVAVVTGAAQGLGRALAGGLVARGVSVVLADIASEQLQTAAEELAACQGQVLPVITDVSDAAAVHALACRTLEHFSGSMWSLTTPVLVAVASHCGRPIRRTGDASWG